MRNKIVIDQSEVFGVDIYFEGKLYCIYTCPENRKRLAIDVYLDKPEAEAEAEETLYNGYMPVKRSILGWLSNQYSDYKTWLYNVTINRKVIKEYRDTFDNL